MQGGIIWLTCVGLKVEGLEFEAYGCRCMKEGTSKHLKTAANVMNHSFGIGALLIRIGCW